MTGRHRRCQRRGNDTAFSVYAPATAGTAVKRSLAACRAQEIAGLFFWTGDTAGRMTAFCRDTVCSMGAFCNRHRRLRHGRRCGQRIRCSGYTHGYRRLIHATGSGHRCDADDKEQDFFGVHTKTIAAGSHKGGVCCEDFLNATRPGMRKIRFFPIATHHEDPV